ncbi:MAG TPA: radical SAM protein [Planctomycetaceae bacterium]|nr:radical SAM protein [Planctomycetaceae bacterium]|tara:strand:+ start:502 stop:1464 length:963 start_codon:yes stop_codon:yes gene_type:complete
MNNQYAHLNDEEILRLRPPKHAVDPKRPYAFTHESEAAANGQVVDVSTVFLTNSECPFRCLMCDLWMNTTDQSVPSGAIPQQIDYALDRLPPARHIKLYNSGNFFDSKAIPPADYSDITQRVRRFENVIVENHPRLCTDKCLHFQSMLEETSLEIAMGLETIHPRVLPALNKQMNLNDYTRAVEYLLNHGIAVRSFILLKPPFLLEEEGVEWALKSIEYAFANGVGCCAVIPTRSGNGMMEQLEAQMHFVPPCLSSLERVMEEGLAVASARGRVIVDLWDLERFANCDRCFEQRRERLHRMNLVQKNLPPIACSCQKVRL